MGADGAWARLRQQAVRYTPPVIVAQLTWAVPVGTMAKAIIVLVAAFGERVAGVAPERTCLVAGTRYARGRDRAARGRRHARSATAATAACA